MATPDEITVSGPGTAEAVEEHLLRFNAFFSASLADGGVANAPLVPPEMALLRTFLVASLSGRFSSPDWKGKSPVVWELDDQLPLG